MSTEQATRNEPTTGAGKALLAEFWPHGAPTSHEPTGAMWEQDNAAIAAIEAEARRNVVEQVREALFDCESEPSRTGLGFTVHRRVISRILDSIATGTEEEK